MGERAAGKLDHTDRDTTTGADAVTTEPSLENSVAVLAERLKRERREGGEAERNRIVALHEGDNAEYLVRGLVCKQLSPCNTFCANGPRCLYIARTACAALAS